jgi:hypothetical protein
LAKNHPQVQFLFVYIAEAHGVDEWPIRSARYTPDAKEVDLLQTKDLKSRSRYSKSFAQNYLTTDWKLFVAPPGVDENDLAVSDFERLYRPWPFRAFAFQKNRLEIISEPIDGEVDFYRFHVWLSQ